MKACSSSSYLLLVNGIAVHPVAQVRNLRVIQDSTIFLSSHIQYTSKSFTIYLQMIFLLH